MKVAYVSGDKVSIEGEEYILSRPVFNLLHQTSIERDKLRNLLKAVLREDYNTINDNRISPELRDEIETIVTL